MSAFHQFSEKVLTCTIIVIGLLAAAMIMSDAAMRYGLKLWP